MALAEKCDITLAQVSNWFGNKRIRFRKAKLKAPRSTEDEEGQNETSEGEEMPPSTKTTQMDMNVKKETL
jgi:pre-B-cell leukemia transcription factor 1